jgi:hypothetical protein
LLKKRDDSNQRIKVGELATPAASSADATARNQELRWEKLATGALIGNKRADCRLVETQKDTGRHRESQRDIDI